LFVIKVSTGVSIEVAFESLDKSIYFYGFFIKVKGWFWLRGDGIPHKHISVGVPWYLWRLATFKLFIYEGSYPLFGIFNTFQVLFFYFVEPGSVFLKFILDDLSKRVESLVGIYYGSMAIDSLYD